METIDRKFQILAVNPCKKGAIYTQADGFFFKATDKFAPHALVGYIKAMKESGEVDSIQIESAELLLQRVMKKQVVEGARTPDIDSDCEIARCIAGKGVE